jgi:hypothetical protein
MKTRNGWTQRSTPSPAATLRGSKGENPLGCARSYRWNQDTENAPVCRCIAGRTQYASGSGHHRAAYKRDPPISISGHDEGRWVPGVRCSRSIADFRWRASRQAHRNSRRAHDGRHSQYASGNVRIVKTCGGNDCRRIERESKRRVRRTPLVAHFRLEVCGRHSRTHERIEVAARAANRRPRRRTSQDPASRRSALRCLSRTSSDFHRSACST